MQIKWLDSLAQVSAGQWDALFAASGDGDCANPFCSHAFLLALEQGGSVGGNSGWHSQHLTVWQGDTLVAAIPGYVKHHSYGEYLFDWQIAEAYQQYGLKFYPKWIAAIPFTPVSGPRLGLLRSDLLDEVLSLVCNELKQQLETHRWSCVQWLFTTQTLQQALTRQGFVPRQGAQFLWHNRGYSGFDDFLQQLKSRKRKNIRQERNRVAGFDIRTLHGAELTELHWQAMVRCYQATYLKRSGHRGYITEHSFALIRQSMADKLVVFAAFSGAQVCADQSSDEDPPRMIAAALCFKGADTLYGRYWGALTEAEHLHFELCYYQGIDYCIRHGLRFFDAGAQGEHKLTRGFEPVTRHGSYLFGRTPLSPAIAQYFGQEALHLTRYREQAAEALPFRAAGQD